MPVVLMWLAALAPTIIPLAFRLLAGIGIAAATYTGINTLWQAAQDQIWANLGATNASILTVIGMARIDDGIKVILSAGATVLILKGLSAATGAITRWRMGPNPGAFSNV